MGQRDDCWTQEVDQVKGDLLEKKRKTYPFLMRRGYSGEVTRKVIGQLQSQYADEYAGEVDEEDMID